MKNIAVIGAGTMGNGIAHTFAQAGFKVQLTDTNPEALKKAIDTISTNLDRMISKEIITDIDKNKTLANISTYTSLNEGIEYASLVIEAATENEAIKIEIFKELDALCPEDTILATNTSSISITQIASHTNRPEQVIGMHFMNPVPLMPLVEIILGYNTSSAVSKTIVELTEIIGKTPISVKDYPGFVANRILMPLINEAIETLYNGIAGVKEIYMTTPALNKNYNPAILYAASKCKVKEVYKVGGAQAIAGLAFGTNIKKLKHPQLIKVWNQ